MKSSSRDASLRRGPLRTVRASFPAYRSSLNQILRQEDRKIPPTTYSLFSFGKLSLTMTRLSLFPAILQVIIPRGIKRIGIPLYLGVTPYRRICRERKRDISVLSVPFCLHTEDPVSIPLLNEVTTFHPPPRFFWMPPACPIPDRPPYFRVHPCERVFGYLVTMVVGPTRDHGVEFGNQRLLPISFGRPISFGHEHSP